jgi:hypothetical protein
MRQEEKKLPFCALTLSRRGFEKDDDWPANPAGNVEYIVHRLEPIERKHNYFARERPGLAEFHVGRTGPFQT